jgi:methylated-DNA-protein-cysteine methyltransferase related protein
MTYGQIAVLLGSRLSPRAVGWAMHGSPRGVPWHRVVNASGGCSTERMPDIAPGLQRHLLEAEGVTFRPNGTLDLERFRWNPRVRRRKGPALP